MASPAESWAASMRTGALCMERGDLRGAAAAFAAAVSHDRGRPEAWVNLSMVNAQLHNIQAAEHAAEKALSIDERFHPALTCMGDVCRLKGELEGAARLYEEACRISPEPLTINNLATVLRTLGRLEQAETLYSEAERLAPRFTLPRLNRAIMQIEVGRFDEAETQLLALNEAPLTSTEREHQQSALLSIAERARLAPVLSRFMESHDASELEESIHATDAKNLEVDEFALEPIRQWLRQLASLSERTARVPLAPLPDDWDEIEAAHMIPIVATAEAFRAWQESPHLQSITEVERSSTQAMLPAITDSNNRPLALEDPVKAEAQLRHLHALCTAGVPLAGLFPGHFKYTQSSTLAHPTARHVMPSKAAGTFRAACELLNDTPPGLARAVGLFLTVVSLHPFGDGNGRCGMILMNRELVKSGLMPAIFSLELGPKGRLGNAEESAYRTSQVQPMLEAVTAGQQHAVNFLAELTGKYA